MLITLQVPLADMRGFLMDSGKLNMPTWPIPCPDREFVRHFGCIRNRKRGGIEGWIGEDTICEAENAFNFTGNLSFVNTENAKVHKLRCAFRRLYFDGLAVGKYEIGISTGQKKHGIMYSKDDIKQLFNHIINLQVRTSLSDGKTHKLIDIGKPISNLYLHSTSKNGFAGSQNWWVTDGRPLLFWDCGKTEIKDFPYHKKQLCLDNDGFILTHSLMPVLGTNVPVWILHCQDYCFKSIIRELRISLMRLHSEHECLRIVLKSIMNGNLKVTPRSQLSDKLQYYFNTVTSRISRLESLTSKLYNSQVVELARKSIDLVYPGQRDSLLEMLERFDIRKNIIRNIMDYCKDWTGPQITIKEEIQMGGDRYINNGQAGAIGPNAHVHDVKFIQTWGDMKDEIDLGLLKQELSTLRAQLKQTASKPDHDIDIGCVAAAEAMAEKGNGNKVLEILSTAGKWVLDTAINIGTSLAAKVIKEATQAK